MNGKTKIKNSLCALVSALLLGAFAESASATVWAVSPGSPGACTLADPNCATIQAAVNASSSNDTINVAAGTYAENVSVSGKSLTFVGEETATTIVDGGGTGSVFSVIEGVDPITAEFQDLTIRNGFASLGGGVYSSAARIILTRCLLTDNDANYDGTAGSNRGGGVYVGDGGLIVHATTFSDNQTNGHDGVGGAIYALGAFPFSVDNSAFSGNSDSFGGGGGAIANDGGDLDLTSCTFSGNSAAFGGGNSLYNLNGATADLSHTILANGSLDNCFGAGIDSPVGHNLSDDDSCGLDGPGDLESVDPLLGPLGDNGGPTPTFLPQTGSPAIDGGADLFIGPFDQRGFPRSVDGDGDHVIRPDIGSVEVEFVDTEGPVAECAEGANPGGNTVPPAGKHDKSGRNPDGFFLLTATDNYDFTSDLEIFVLDTGSGTVFGPFESGTVIKYTQASGPPSQKQMGGDDSSVAWHLKGNGDAAVFAVDTSDNAGDSVSCLVPK